MDVSFIHVHITPGAFILLKFGLFNRGCLNTLERKKPGTPAKIFVKDNVHYRDDRCFSDLCYIHI